MERVKVEVQTRSETGKGAARKLRRQGLVPAVVYGLDRPPQPLVVRRETAERIIRLGTTALLDLVIDGAPPSGEVAAIVKDFQRHPVSRELLCLDFQWVSLTETVDVPVPVEVVGQAPGLQQGGILEQHLHEVTVRCLPTEIPDHLEIDITGLEIGDSLHVRDIKLPEGVEILEDEEETVVVIAAPKVAAEEEEAAEAAEEVEEAVAEEGEEAAEEAEEKAESGEESGE